MVYNKLFPASIKAISLFNNFDMLSRITITTDKILVS